MNPLNLLRKKAMQKFAVNTGYTPNLYNERMAEIPWIFQNIDKPPATVLDIGCCESIMPINLAFLGYKVTGVDIRDYGYRHLNFTFIKEDFNYLKADKLYDVIISMSSIEHFGLGSYGNIEPDESNGDIVAVEKVKSLLKPKGQFLITVPYDHLAELILDDEEVIIRYEKGQSFERIYTEKSFDRLTKGFEIISKNFYDTKYNGHGVLCLNLRKVV